MVSYVTRNAVRPPPDSCASGIKLFPHPFGKTVMQQSFNLLDCSSLSPHHLYTLLKAIIFQIFQFYDHTAIIAVALVMLWTASNLRQVSTVI